MNIFHWQLAHLRFRIEIYSASEDQEALQNQLLSPSSGYRYYGIARLENKSKSVLEGMIWTESQSHSTDDCRVRLQERIEHSLIKMQVIAAAYWLVKWQNQWVLETAGKAVSEPMSISASLKILRVLSQDGKAIYAAFQASQALDTDSGDIIFSLKPQFILYQGSLYPQEERDKQAHETQS